MSGIADGGDDCGGDAGDDDGGDYGGDDDGVGADAVKRVRVEDGWRAQLADWDSGRISHQH